MIDFVINEALDAVLPREPRHDGGCDAPISASAGRRGADMKGPMPAAREDVDVARHEQMLAPERPQRKQLKCLAAERK
jgi:hypothetical protein